MSEQNNLSDFFSILPTIADRHAPSDLLHLVLKRAARTEFEQAFSRDSQGPVDLGSFGSLIFPYEKMGAVDSVNLFDLDELILFSFYMNNRNRYKHVADIGANIGLHCIILSRCGFQVRCFEPDPVHMNLLKRNLKLNNVTTVETNLAAVSSQDGFLEFIRVKGNTTGSHLAGSKPDPYGELDRFEVKVMDIKPILVWADLIKLDAEGHEGEILLAAPASEWVNTDAVVEVGSPENAEKIFNHFSGSGLRFFAQKSNWAEVTTLEDMPVSYKDGSLFITRREGMDWPTV